MVEARPRRAACQSNLKCVSFGLRTRTTRKKKSDANKETQEALVTRTDILNPTVQPLSPAKKEKTMMATLLRLSTK